MIKVIKPICWTSILILSVLLMSGLGCANQYIESTVTGELAIGTNDSAEYWLHAEQIGIYTIILEKDSTLGADLSLFDAEGFLVTQSTEPSNGNQAVYVEVSAADLETDGFLDFRVQISARYGVGLYKVRVLRPQQTHIEVFMRNIAHFNFQLTAGSSPKDYFLIWKGKHDEVIDDIPVKISVMKRETKAIVYTSVENGGTLIELFSDLEQWPISLNPGQYSVILEKTNYSEQSWEIMASDSFVSGNPSFRRQMMEKDQEDNYDIYLTGVEEFLWVFWDTVNSKQIPTMLEVTLSSNTGTIYPVEYLLVNNGLYIPVSGLIGDYNLRVKSRDMLVYTVGVETAQQFVPLYVNLLSIKHSLEESEQAIYDLSFQVGQSITVTISNPTDSFAKIEFGKLSESASFMTILPSGTINHTFNFSTEQRKGFWLKCIEGEINYVYSVQFMDGFVPAYDVIQGDSVEIADGLDNPKSVYSNIPIYANLSSSTDEDFYRFNLANRSFVNLQLDEIPVDQNYTMQLYNSRHISIATMNSLSGTIAKELETGEYYLKVKSISGYSAEKYRLKYSVVYRVQSYEINSQSREVNLALTASEKAYMILIPLDEDWSGVSCGSISVSRFLPGSGSGNQNITQSAHVNIDSDTSQNLQEGLNVESMRSEQNLISPLNAGKEKYQLTSAGDNVLAPFIGMQKLFKVEIMKGIFTNRTFVLKAIGTACYVWIDAEIFAEQSEVEPYNEIKENFENTIRPVLTRYFGNEPTSVTYSVLNDQRTNIFITPLVQRTGYFRSEDLYSQTSDPNSNEIKALYVSAAQFSDLRLLMSSIAEEYQHMLFYHQKKIANREGEDQWIDQCFSSLAADIVGYGFEQESASLANAYWNMVVQKYLELSYTVNLLRDDDVSLDSKGAKYLFGRYLFEKVGDYIMLEINSNSLSVQDVIFGYTMEPFIETLEKYALTLLLSSDKRIDPCYRLSFGTGQQLPNLRVIEIKNGEMWDGTVNGIGYFRVGPGEINYLLKITFAEVQGNYRVVVLRERTY